MGYISPEAQEETSPVLGVPHGSIFSHMNAVAKLFADALKYSGMSERAACEAAGVNESALKNIRSGKAQFPRVDTAAKLAAVLDIHPALLIEAASGRTVTMDEIRMAQVFSRLPAQHRSQLLQIADLMARDAGGAPAAVLPPAEPAPAEISPRKRYTLHDAPAPLERRRGKL